MMNDIQILNISYTAQNKKILHDVSFTIKKEECFALIGKNGSGKSTLIDIMMQDLKQDHGKVILPGESKTNFGVLYDHLPLMNSLKVKEILKYYCTLHKLSYRDISERYFDDFEIAPIEESFIRTLSLGEKKRVSILLVIMHDPDYLILDEPFANIDPTITERIWKHLKRKGRTLFFTTHNWSDAEKRADKLVFMTKGELIGDPVSPVDALRNLPAQKKLIFAHDESLEQSLGSNSYYVHDGNVVCFFENDHELMNTIVQHTSNFSIQNVDLTDVYLYNQKAQLHD